MGISHIINLECSRCKKEHDHKELNTVCKKCEGTLFARYDIEYAKNNLEKKDLLKRDKNMWRYKELLPVINKNNIISLSEGYTPIIDLKKIGVELKMKNLYTKDDGIIPTGTFKARGQSAAISKAKDLGVKTTVLASAGNAGGALATYSKKAELESYVFMPSDAPKINIDECLFFGANVFLVDGLINDAGKIAASCASEYGWFNLSTLKEPYRVEGKKTMGYEIAEEMKWNLPDVIIYPTGGGTGLVGMWKAFEELEQLGWITKHRPRMISVQSTTCNPVVKAIEEQKDSVEPFPNAKTIASGMRVPAPYASEQILKVIRESSGTAISVDDDKIIKAMKEFSKEGIYASPEGAATLVALKKLIDNKDVDKDDKVILYNTGSVLKYGELIDSKERKIIKKTTTAKEIKMMMNN